MKREEQIKEAFAKFRQTVASLRDPESGCPWDLQQDHKSLRRYMLEEAYEAFEAMSGEGGSELCEELGDVLLQVVLNAQLASERGAFDLLDVVREIDEKMVRRHPHVFGEEEDRSEKAIRRNWESIKQAEKRQDSPKKKSRFEGIRRYPASHCAYEIGKASSRINFDWETPDQVHVQLESEVAELAEAFASGDKAHIAEEISDVFFTLSQLCRHLGLDPEVVASDGNQKFIDRFRKVEALAKKAGREIEKMERAELEKLWNQAKS